MNVVFLSIAILEHETASKQNNKSTSRCIHFFFT